MGNKIRLRDFFRFAMDRPKSFAFGSAFVIFPTFLLIFVLMIIRAIDSGAKKPDYEILKANGRKTEGAIQAVIPMENIEINGQNPIRVIYGYRNRESNESIVDTVETMIKGSETADKVSVFYTDTDSMVENLVPFEFPYALFFIMPFIFLVPALPFLIYSLHGAIQKASLYNKGMVGSARILGMVPIFMGPLALASPRFNIMFSYKNEKGEELNRTSVISDLSIINNYKAGEFIDILVSREKPGMACVSEKLGDRPNPKQMSTYASTK